MSKHWRPDEDVARARFGADKRLRSLDEFVPPELIRRAKRQRLPDGGKAGLVLVAAACLGVAIGISQLFGPRDVFARGAEAAMVERSDR